MNYNYKTNCDCFLNMPRENLFSIDLYDSSGNRVNKTDSGNQFGLPLTKQQIEDWLNKNRRWHGYLSMICPGEGLQAGVFSIPEMFVIKQPDEYTLHVRMRLMQGPQLVAWLPEATAKVQIRPEDIAPKSSLPNTQTNSLAK